MKHIGTQEIVTERLVLRPFVVEDYQAMFENWTSDSKAARYVTWDVHENEEFTKELMVGWCQSYNDPTFYKWGICLQDNPNQVIGDISVVGIDEKRACCELGYVLSSKLWGQGIMTEALVAVLDYLLLEADVNRVQARFATENPASGRVMTKAGMTYEGTLRQADLLKGRLVDVSLYSKLQSD